jgi:ABC-type sulfate transport system permease subunit
VLPTGDETGAVFVMPRGEALRMEENFAFRAIVRRFPRYIISYAAFFVGIGALSTFSSFPDNAIFIFRPRFGLHQDVRLIVHLGLTITLYHRMVKKAFKGRHFELSRVQIPISSGPIHVAIDIVTLRNIK